VYYTGQDPVSAAHSGTILSVFFFRMFTHVDIYTAATVLLGAQMCLKSIQLDEEWQMALDYLKRISSKSVSAQQCVTILEVLHHQLRILRVMGVVVIVDSSPNDQEMAAVSEESPLYPLSSHSPSPLLGNVDLQDSTSVNVDWPWDWNIMDNIFARRKCRLGGAMSKILLYNNLDKAMETEI